MKKKLWIYFTDISTDQNSFQTSNLIIISLFWLKFRQSKGWAIIEENFPLENTKPSVISIFR